MTDDRSTTTGDGRDTPVVLSRIYTRTGDDGTTALADGARVAKTDPRLAAYADTDEANCAIGAAITLGALPGDMANLLRRIQNELFEAAAALATPLPADPGVPQLRIDESYVMALEEPATSTTPPCRPSGHLSCRAEAPAPPCSTRQEP